MNEAAIILRMCGHSLCNDCFGCVRDEQFFTSNTDAFPAVVGENLCCVRLKLGEVPLLPLVLHPRLRQCYGVKHVFHHDWDLLVCHLAFLLHRTPGQMCGLFKPLEEVWLDAPLDVRRFHGCHLHHTGQADPTGRSAPGKQQNSVRHRPETSRSLTERVLCFIHRDTYLGESTNIAAGRQASLLTARQRNHCIIQR